jgi:hypothetical protein
MRLTVCIEDHWGRNRLMPAKHACRARNQARPIRLSPEACCWTARGAARPPANRNIRVRLFGNQLHRRERTKVGLGENWQRRKIGKALNLLLVDAC